MLITALEFIGIILQIAAIILAYRSDALKHAIQAAWTKIPGNPLLDAYENAKQGTERKITSEEHTYNKLAVKLNPNKAFTDFRRSVILLLSGLAAQLVALILDLPWC